MRTNRTFASRLVAFLLAAVGSLASADAKSPLVPGGPKLDTAKIEQLTGAKGTLSEQEGVFKVNLPRTDLKVTVGKVKMTPPMGLTAWAAFTPAHGQVMVMGDIVLLEEQVSPVMGVALDNGLEVTALHNHFLGDSPKVMFMHIGGMGSLDQLATAVGKIFAKLREPSSGAGFGTEELDPASTTLDPKVVDDNLGVKGTLASGVYKVTIGRTTKMHGVEVGNAMGVNTWAAFVGSNDKAVVDGDFAMLESELQDVLKALRGAGIHVVAIHNHMTMESPRILFLHYWGIGKVAQLAQGLKAALAKTAHGK
jgi:hypothetical protein